MGPPCPIKAPVGSTFVRGLLDFVPTVLFQPVAQTAGIRLMTQRFARLVLLVALSLSALCTAVEAARPDRWVRIVQHRIDSNTNEEMIDLRDTEGSFVGFQLRARGGRVEIEKIELNFQDKTKHKSEAPFSLSSGERTKVIARDDAERFPETLLVKYKQNARNGSYAQLELWGLQTREGRYAKRPEKLMPVPPPPARVAHLELEVADSMLIAAKNVGREVEYETLKVDEHLSKFKRLRLAARDSDAPVSKLSVIFEDGSIKEFSVDGLIRSNTSTPWFDIDGGKFIKEVHLDFSEKTSLSTPARIELYGTQSDGWAASEGEGAKFNDGWVLLGAQAAGFVGFDNDVIQLSEHGGGFTELRVNVLGRAVTLNQLRVVYDSGEEDIVPVRTRIDAGDAYGPISLRGATHRVREIQARYRSRVIDRAIREKGLALVQVWAKR
jgi:hypothetical protein